MTTYIALLRGINVGGRHIVKMTALKSAFETLGLTNVQTFIQSGNVLFQSEEAEELLREKIERELERVFEFPMIVVLRTAESLARIIADCPFSAEELAAAESASDSESLYVALLTQAPPADNLARVKAYEGPREMWQVIGRDVYLLLHESIRSSKLADNLHRLEVPATVRNWNTLNRLLALAKAMEQ